MLLCWGLANYSYYYIHGLIAARLINTLIPTRNIFLLAHLHQFLDACSSTFFLNFLHEDVKLTISYLYTVDVMKNEIKLHTSMHVGPIRCNFDCNPSDRFFSCRIHNRLCLTAAPYFRPRFCVHLHERVPRNPSR